MYEIDEQMHKAQFLLPFHQPLIFNFAIHNVLFTIDEKGNLPVKEPWRVINL